MRFRLFGIPTEIQLGFWLLALMVMSQDELFGPRQYLIVVWVLSVLLSVLVHELGHAVVMMRYGLRPEITLHMMGGATASPGLPNLTRTQRIFVSFAGPLAGFLLAAVVYGVATAVPSLGSGDSPAEVSMQKSLAYLWWVNTRWGMLNLLPVLPLDGGHIVQDLVGPKRTKIAAGVALAVGLAVVGYAAMERNWWLMVLIGAATFYTVNRYRAEAAPAPVARPKPEPEEDVAPEVVAQLRDAESALADERHEQAVTLADLVLSANPPKRTRMAALTVIGWAELLEGNPDRAARAIRAIQRDGEPDPALMGAVLMAQERLDDARNVLEGARAVGDDRKEVVGPLIQILIRQDEVARAAAIALDIVETLSEEDARQMATIAFEHGAYPWASRLSEAVFERSGIPDDAYDAARGRALEGDVSGALIMLRRAVAAGFSDAARLWSDKALEALRSSAEEASELETLLPPP